MKQKNFARSFLCVLGLLSTLLYTNCEKPSISSLPSGSSSLASGNNSNTSTTDSGNGGGYDGKLYVVVDLAKTCADKEGSVSKIRSHNNAFQLERWDCVNLAKPEIVTVTRPTLNDPNQDVIVYRSRLFDNQQRILSGAQSPAKGYCSQKNVFADLIGFPQATSNDFSYFAFFSVNTTGNLEASLFFGDNNSSDDFITDNHVLGPAPLTSGAPVGNYSAPNLLGTAGFEFSFNITATSVSSKANNVSAFFADDPSVTGTVQNVDTPVTQCIWN